MLIAMLLLFVQAFTLPGCDESAASSSSPSAKAGRSSSSADTSKAKQADVARSPAGLELVDVTLAGEAFHLELAADEPTRTKGLMGRESIDKDGGMLFVFPRAQVRVQNFWMKNCLTDMDILFLDASGRVLATHEMKKQPLQGKDPAAGPDESEKDYEDRIQKTASYSSRFPATFAIELAPGRVKELGINEGDKVEFDAPALKARAR